MAKKTESKTTPTTASVDAFLKKTAGDRLDDCKKIVTLMERASGEPATMWGPYMVGFGTRHYQYDSGRSGDIFRIGFAPRKSNITLYLHGALDNFPDDVKKLGKLKSSVGCLYVNKLSDIDLTAFEMLLKKCYQWSTSSKTKDVSKQSVRKPKK